MSRRIALARRDSRMVKWRQAARVGSDLAWGGPRPGAGGHRGGGAAGAELGSNLALDDSLLRSQPAPPGLPPDGSGHRRPRFSPGAQRSRDRDGRVPRELVRGEEDLAEGGSVRTSRARAYI